jgi:hypothetical protein
MGHCKHCAQEEKLDSFGYCIKYSCFKRSGLDVDLEYLKRKAWGYLVIPKGQSSPLGITSYVTNNFNVRTRYCNSVMDEARTKFGFVPQEILSIIPVENQKPWDKNIRW